MAASTTAVPTTEGLLAHVKVAACYLNMLAKSTGTWQHVKTKKGVIVTKRPLDKDSREIMARGQTVINVSPLALLELVQNTSRKAEWDEIFEKAEVVCELDAQSRIEHHVYKTPISVVTKRDFCIAGHWMIGKDGTIVVVIASISDDRCPPIKEFVRGTIRHAGFIIQPLLTKEKDEVKEEKETGKSEEKKSEEAEEQKVWKRLVESSASAVTFFACVDLAGWVPDPIVQMMGLKQPLTLITLRALAEKEKITNPVPPARLALYKSCFGKD